MKIINFSKKYLISKNVSGTFQKNKYKAIAGNFLLIIIFYLDRKKAKKMSFLTKVISHENS